MILSRSLNAILIEPCHSRFDEPKYGLSVPHRLDNVFIRRPINRAILSCAFESFALFLFAPHQHGVVPERFIVDNSSSGRVGEEAISASEKETFAHCWVK